jgi:hypothetical protein
MRSHMKAALILSCLPVFLAGTARGGEGVDVKITNDGTEDIVVTVYDMSGDPGRMVLANARINGFSSVPISVVGDASGQAHLQWTATSTDPTFPKCGHAHTIVGNAGSVNVHVDSSCSV